MEKSKSCNQAIIPNPHSDHGLDSKPNGAVLMSADSREAGQVSWDGNGTANRPLDARETSRLIRTGGRDTMAFRRRRRGSIAMFPFLLVLIASVCFVPVASVFIEFSNCLSDEVKNNGVPQLQFIPHFVDATFNTTDPSHQLSVTVWGNITGSTVGNVSRLVVPSGNDTEYWNSNSTFAGGKIVDSPYPEATVPKLTTLSNKVDVLTYEPFSEDVDFCNSLINGSCPLGPRFFVNA